MERTETKIDRELVERVRERARREGRDESELIEDALRRYLNPENEQASQPSITFSDLIDRERERREQLGEPELSEEEAMRIAVEEQHAARRGE
ncbi:MAG: ribbon-helix-helix protein, CopG family [Rubrobacteraceae bacterium]